LTETYSLSNHVSHVRIQCLDCDCVLVESVLSIMHDAVIVIFGSVAVEILEDVEVFLVPSRDVPPFDLDEVVPIWTALLVIDT